VGVVRRSGLLDPKIYRVLVRGRKKGSVPAYMIQIRISQPNKCKYCFEGKDTGVGVGISVEQSWCSHAATFVFEGILDQKQVLISLRTRPLSSAVNWS
jgi:AhpD family alkylhydroperoxidase